jgi:inhibitor of KinA
LPLKPISVYPSGEQALTISFGNTISLEINAQVLELYHRLKERQTKFWVDLIPAYSTLTVVYDAVAIRRHQISAFEWIRKELMEVLEADYPIEKKASRTITVPVCYALKFGLDSKSILATKKITIEKLVELHTAITYRVFMIGFLPGFAYLGIVDDKIAAPRLAKPHAHVPAGSVGIAGNQTGIYPLDSPGGWNIIGRTPVRIFDAESPALLQPGDNVKFVSITKEEFEVFDQRKFKWIDDGP